MNVKSSPKNYIHIANQTYKYNFADGSDYFRDVRAGQILTLDSSNRKLTHAVNKDYVRVAFIPDEILRDFNKQIKLNNIDEVFIGHIMPYEGIKIIYTAIVFKDFSLLKPKTQNYGWDIETVLRTEIIEYMSRFTSQSSEIKDLVNDFSFEKYYNRFLDKTKY